jgi:hypothetical protein
MSCQKFEMYINENLDLESLKIHIESCDECRKAYQMDEQIMQRARDLNTNLTVPDLWPALENNILKKRTVIHKFKKNKKILYAAAATFLIFTTLFIFDSYWGDHSTDRILSKNALEKVKKAENKYIEAIEELESTAYLNLENTAEPLAQLYRNKLLLIDQQIANCRMALETNPANSHIRRYLMAALKDKRETLEEILKVNG